PTPPITGFIYDVDVYNNRVTGYAPKYSTVKLYKNGVYIGSDVADGSGYFSISNTFGYYDNGYWYNGKWYGERYHYYDLNDYKLQAYSGTTLLDTYYLKNADAHYYDGSWGPSYPNYPNWYPSYNTRVYPTSLDLNYGNDSVSGYLHSYPNTYVSIYRDGVYLGSGYTNSNGYFNIALNRRINSLAGLDYYVGNRSVYDESYGERVYPWSLSVSLYNINGYYNPNTVVRAYYDGKYVGTATTDSKGYFSISSDFRIYNDSRLKFYSDKKVVETDDVYKTEITIGSGALTKTVNGITTTTYMDVAAYIKDGRTMLPIRFVAESLGYYVTFNDATRNATFSDGNKVVVINIDSYEFYVDGVKHTFNVKPEIKNSRTMLPISEIGKALGLTHGNKGEGKNIEWDAVNQKVLISVTKTK
ncbi:MAG: copper amine oxidase N-terminal domain-containing protein, partial [Peptoniphilus sp.]|nr:copper amine oxidase N-terminal domain-containing protein [Peptoniphilus sp.]